MTRTLSRIAAGLTILMAAGLPWLTGCESSSTGWAPAPGGFHSKSASADTVYGAVVSYEGSTFDGETTTFAYRLVPESTNEDFLYKFYLELPDCSPDVAATEPTDASVGYYPDVGLDAVRWTVNIEPGDLEPRHFSVTFPGEVDEGVVHTVVRGYGQWGVGQVYGPCGGNEVTGVVFVDTDGDGVQAPTTEGGITGVVVQAVDDQGQWESAVTDSTGAYRLLLVDGLYTVFVDTTGQAGLVNADLGSYWSATTELSQDVTLPPDAEGVSFGFEPLIDDLVDDIIDDEIESLGVPVKFWLNEFAWALDPQEWPEDLDRRVLEFDTPFFTPEELLAFLDQVEALALPEPYQFTDGEEFLDVLGILSAETGTPEELLLKELLVTELNFVADRGFVNDPELLEALIVWGESLLVQAQEAPSPLLAQDLRVAIELFQTINVGGGGGFDW